MIRANSRAASTRLALVRWLGLPRWGLPTIPNADQTPLRAELFNADQMEQHAILLAAAHDVNNSSRRVHLLKRLDENEQVLAATCRGLTQAVLAKLRITPAGEWLLDNYYLVEEQIRSARKHLPTGYSRELPRLARGQSTGLPRVYDLALELISHGDGRVDAQTLARFVAAYQSVVALKLGELWAIPIMLRLALIENLRRVAARISEARRNQDRARHWADQMMEVAQSDPKSLILVIAEMARSNPPLGSPFVAEIARRLQGHGPSLAWPLTWIEQRLSESSQTIEQMVVAESQRQAADQVSISNSIASLRFLGAMNWRDFVESMSVVEKTLQGDPAGVYSQMDFGTRDRYRIVIDRLAKRCPFSEVQLAQTCVDLAQASASSHGNEDRRAHVGYFLIDDGYWQLVDAACARVTLVHTLQRFAQRHTLFLYLGSILSLTTLLCTTLVLNARAQGIGDWRILAMLAVLALLGTSQLASNLSNWLATILMQPELLPRLDYARGLPPEMRTLVAIPAMIGTHRENEELLEGLEVRFLGNQDAQLHFALLTDLADAPQESMAEDAASVWQLQHGIELLNEKYRHLGNDRFHLFHRRRTWNVAEGAWMGYERKRGKLAALNSFLRGSGADSFSVLVGNMSPLSGVRFVITLDTDTSLPRDSARQFVGAMAHRLNRPMVSAANRTICAGYGILQPGIATGFSPAGRSAYASLCGSEPGIDPYTHCISNVYQDLFGQGSFIGKGIYDIDAFEFAMGNRFPENRILSHDLLEGAYARSGLLSDVPLSEEYPASYLADMRRHCRWIRGDWQVAGWIFPRVPGPQARQEVNPLSGLSRWKILDNLRRNLALLSLPLMLTLGWTVLSDPRLISLMVLSVFLLPPLLTLGLSAVQRPLDASTRAHLISCVESAGRALCLAAFRIACLPYEAMLGLDAMLRAAWRLFVSHRKLLEWSPSQDSGCANRPGLSSTLKAMWIAPAAALFLVIVLLVDRATSLPVATPVLLLWFVAPILAWRLSQARDEPAAKLTQFQELFLRNTARRTWSFFERFVTAADNYLPPDNFQEHPGPVLAHRTSPTNMGLALLANLSAFDFGYLSAGGLVERTESAFRTMVCLERYKGHFFNWYDTQTLVPLPPRYISSVDSGNLAGHLITLGAGLLELPDRPLASPVLFEGMEDTLAALAKVVAVETSISVVSTLIMQLQSILANARAVPEVGLTCRFERLVAINSTAGDLAAAAAAHCGTDAKSWATVLAGQCRGELADLQQLAPWLLSHASLPELFAPTDIGLACSARTLAQLPISMNDSLDRQMASATSAEGKEWIASLRLAIGAGAEEARKRIAAFERLASYAERLAVLDYEFLYDQERHLLAIGYNVEEYRRDSSYYDLLASEARLCTFVAIAQGKLPQECWFALGRLLTNAGADPILISWSGSMFEYLMPLLVMPTYPGTLLDQTCRGAVRRQIAYGVLRSLPWGVSESCYNTVDANLNFQYHAFGVPGLGLKRGLAEDLVIAPYASAMALMLAPVEACTNLQRLAASGLLGPFGFYESVDYTPSRLMRGQTNTIIHSFMAHHQGMILLALAQRLLDRPMQRRFASVPAFQATLLLLQERIPKAIVVREGIAEHSAGSAFFGDSEGAVLTPLRADTPRPEVQLLSNGRYHVMLTNSGGGQSRWKDLALSRWREDPTSDNWGSFLYVRDVESGKFWSASHQPTLQFAESYEAMFSEGRAEFRRRDEEIETYTEIVVSPEDDIELRRVRIANRSRRRRVMELTSYAELVLATSAADLLQPSFGGLFVQTQILAERQAVLCTRRPRSAGEMVPWLCHLFSVHGAAFHDFSYETDRLRFLGRGGSVERPMALTQLSMLSGTDGAVLDPIMAIRCRVILEAGQTATIDVVTGAADTREACVALIEKYRDRHLADRVFELAITHSGVTLRQINASEADAHLYRQLAGPLLFSSNAMRAQPELLTQNRRGQSGLWGYAISGDLPIVLLKVANPEHIDLVRQMIQCHAYWRLKGLKADLLIWNEENPGYRARLQDLVMGLIANGVEANAMNRPGGIFVRSSSDQVSNEDRILLHTVARVILCGDRGSLADQVNRRGLAELRSARLLPTRAHRPDLATSDDPIRPDLGMANHLGGFDVETGEYCIRTDATRMTPLPWVNVIANPCFGTVVSESGLGYTWSENAHEFRLTPWGDDAVGSTGGEALYLRDEESGHYWSPAPQPTRGSLPYLTRHGFGYSVFTHVSGGVHSELWVYVDAEEAVKFSVLKVRNASGRPRRLSATGYVEWVLGDARQKTAMYVNTEIDPASGALFARNLYNTEYAGRVAFFDVDDASRTLSGDRTEFLGRNGSLHAPEAMTRTVLSGRLGAALDPCGAIRVPFELDDGQEQEVIFRLGTGETQELARSLALRLRQPGSARLALQRVRKAWTLRVGSIQVQTPDPAMDQLANGWLVYQTLSCRIWARTGFYQSGGAFGFRDQLQDVLALLHVEPGVAREHLLRCAGRQYPQGDVQHWWHPPSGRGVRTRCSDDYLWLALAACRYVNVTGDCGILDENVSFLEGRALAPGEESYYDIPGCSTKTASLYAHCVLAIEHGLQFGAHGLPLMGSGDWNDGMNLVGIHGQGESVWLGFFLYHVLMQFCDLADGKGDSAFANQCRFEAERLQENLERHGWDGGWYRRAYFDDGTPLGSRMNSECQIDAIAQSWAVLSGAAPPERARLAIDAMDRRLVDRENRLARLLAPPFDHSTLDPGYIKGYLPGVRENGGQYTHAAVWAAMALAALGEGRRAVDLLAMINPVNHGRSAQEVATYKAEPYVVAADVYSLPPHAGRGGWTWYTGSAGWFYRLIIESILGLRREGTILQITPCIPPDWPGFNLVYRYGQSSYRVVVTQSAMVPGGAIGRSLRHNGEAIATGQITLVDDGAEHRIELHLARDAEPKFASLDPTITTED